MTPLSPELIHSLQQEAKLRRNFYGRRVPLPYPRFRDRLSDGFFEIRSTL
jgi:hypothetical protein